MSAPEGKTDVPREPGHFRFWHFSDMAFVLDDVRSWGEAEIICSFRVFRILTQTGHLPVIPRRSAPLDRLIRVRDHAALGELGWPPWLSELGCGAIS